MKNYDQETKNCGGRKKGEKNLWKQGDERKGMKGRIGGERVKRGSEDKEIHIVLEKQRKRRENKREEKVYGN